LTTDELGEMLSSIVEQKLIELFGDPEEGLDVRKILHDRLVRQLRAVEKGERGSPMGKIMKKHNLRAL
jgi:hypothetical protein